MSVSVICISVTRFVRRFCGSYPPVPVQEPTTFLIPLEASSQTCVIPPVVLLTIGCKKLLTSLPTQAPATPLTAPDTVCPIIVLPKNVEFNAVFKVLPTYKPAPPPATAEIPLVICAVVELPTE